MSKKESCCRKWAGVYPHCQKCVVCHRGMWGGLPQKLERSKKEKKRKKEH
jgi:hypothetical protein